MTHEKNPIKSILSDFKDLQKKVLSDTKTIGAACFRLFCRNCNQTLILTPDSVSAEYVYYSILELSSIAGENFQLEFYDKYSGNSKQINPNENRLLKFLQDIQNGKSSVISSVDTFVKNLPTVEEFLSSKSKIRVGDKVEFGKFSQYLADIDYDNEYQVNAACEFALRGGLIDVFSPVEEYPARIEFFGDEIESIRLFSYETQKTLERVDSYSIAPRSYTEKSTATLKDYFPANVRIILLYPAECRKRFQDSGYGWDSFFDLAAGEGRVFEILRTIDAGFSNDSSEPLKEIALPIPDIFEGEDTTHIGDIGRELYSHLMCNKISYWSKGKYRIFIFVETPSGKNALTQWLKNNSMLNENINFIEHSLHTGFIVPDSKSVFLSEKEIYFLPHKKHFNFKNFAAVKSKSSEKIALIELQPGDYVVHLLHGIGLFHGMTQVESAGVQKEVFEVEYEDGIMLYVPVWQAYLLTRYVGTKKELPTLSRIGSGRWSTVKEAAMVSAKSLAAELLRIQAVRFSGQGYGFPDDNDEMQNFERTFPFPETPDQLKAIADVKKDLISPKPMDRLICGDVGFGKTEVAMRAAFRAVMDGKQVAVLTPTTILAQQHYYTFTDRFSEHPVIIEVISRFKTQAEQKKILSDLTEKKIDILIGTHRLLQSDVNFPELGLLIIDEEQKFGVQHKEKLKHLRATIDILTMTATPIPRTLHLALSGLRDLSTIESAPVNRLPIQTVLCKFDKSIIFNAVMNEVKRGGQVFFLHNRVKTIEERAVWLKNILPGVRIAVGHGQMDSESLEKVMSDFIDGKLDVLLCSTIIESGVDIPNANTIIIERADMFGLAELYQLRGRVGRWTRQAFAYLTIPDSALMSNTARERLSAIKKYTQLGAGFRLALKDLEIRGTGNILGAQQSGHVNAVGFNLYCQLLKSSVNALKNNKELTVFYVDIFLDFVDFSLTFAKGKINACFPVEYIPSEELRINFYIRASQLSTVDDAEELRLELVDRFGKLPIEADRFLDIMQIRAMVGTAGYNSLAVKECHIYIEGPNSRQFLSNNKIPKLKCAEGDLKLSELKKYTKGILANN
ncbi:MAG TPA: transcription-repair coupling factor [Lentisphaeria bacterium]|nr:MAG: transcription-repair coupling factor [Lentisphaerae bacterium GWF2_38_69]HBM15620.1 transcription-repair coupling factor [Lentisphaeria bacterium]